MLPIRVKYYQQVFKHKSKHREARLNNERLELLGDAILSAIVTDYLYREYPEKDEGFLTNLKSKIVSRKMLNEIGRKLDLLDKLSYHEGSVQQDPTVLYGNTFEALLGAIYLDLGFDAAYEFVEGKVFGELIDLKVVEQQDFDFKSKLFIYAQRKGMSLDFVTVEEETRNSRKFFTIAVVLDGEEVARGSGYNKKGAEQRGSEKALFQLEG
jgi:ribonuclease-3